MKSIPFLTTSVSASLLFCATSSGETITQTIGNIDWTAAMWGTPAAVPTAGNDYVTVTGVASDTVRISANGGSTTFPGNSLRVIAGTRAILKNQNNALSTMNGNLILEGRLSHAPNNGPHAARLDIQFLEVRGTAAVIDINGSSTFTIDGVLTGSGSLLFKPELTTTGAGTVSITGIQNFTGPITVQSPVRLDFGVDYVFTNTMDLQGLTSRLNVDQLLTFEFGKLKANGVTVAPGTYSGASLTALGDHFIAAGGTLVVVEKDTDGDGLPDWYEDRIIAFRVTDEVDGYEDIDGPNVFPSVSDFDGDGLTDAAEYAEGNTEFQTDPTLPDMDGDGLTDAQEVFGRDASNAATGFGPTNPKVADSDGDGFGDLIEIRYGSHPVDAALKPGSAVVLVNGDFEEPLVEQAGQAARASLAEVPGWVVGKNDFFVLRAYDLTDVNNPTGPSHGLQFASADRRAPNPDVEATVLDQGIDSSMSMSQVVDVSALASEIDFGNRTVLLAFDWRENDTADEGQVSVDFLNGSGASLGRSAIFRTSGGVQAWTRTILPSYPPIGTRMVRITVGATKVAAGPSSIRNVAFDRFDARLVAYDKDLDGLPDDWELANGLNPDDASDVAGDADEDGLSSLEEFALGTNPQVADTDGDGFADGVEVAAGTDPLDAVSTPEPVGVRVTDFVVTKNEAGQVTRVEIEFRGLDPSKTYRLMRGIDLVSFPMQVDSRQPVATTERFIDADPLPGETASRAFYRLED